MKVAVVRNTTDSRVLSRLGQPCPETYGQRSVEAVVDSLREGGHEVDLFEGDVTLLKNLEDFFGLDAEHWAVDGIVFNMVYGIQGECRYTHLPGTLEMAGIPYTGSSPLGHALSLDKVITKTLIHAAGLPTPRWMVAGRPNQDPEDLRFPLMVKPRHESTSFGLRLVYDREELEDAVYGVLSHYDQEALVEEYIDGREVCVGLLGNEPVECLPPVELCFQGRGLRAFTWEDKMHKREDEPEKRCPADLPEKLADRLREIAVGVFGACHCKDYARVDFRIDSSGRPYVLEINSMASLGERASYVLAAEAVGYSFSSLVCRIVDVAHQRYLGAEAAVGEASPRVCVLCQASTEAEPSEPPSSDGVRLSEEFAA